MHNFLPVVLGLGLLLAVVTLVGHGIWVLLAVLFGGRASKSVSPGYRCPFCRRELPDAAHRCDWCGRLVDLRMAAELADLDAVERQLRRFEQTGAMKPDAAAKLAARVRDYRQRLLVPATVKEAPPTPVVATLVENLTPSRSAQQPPAAVVPQRRPLPQTEAGPSDFRSGKKLDSRQPAPPAKSWTEILAGFMEERNIRWAEFVGVLVGGLLIVGASLALVISFWDTLQATYLKFLVFVGYSSAVFGVGLFAYHRWKLHSTGRGLLTISTLLVPLNFVAMASLSPESWSWQTAATEVISLAIFAWLSALAADVIAPGRRWSMVLAVVGNSALVLLGARLLGGHGSDGLLLAAGCAPAVLLAAATGSQLVDCRNFRPSEDGTVPSLHTSSHPIDASDAAGRLTLLGMAAFATAVAMGVILSKAGAGVALPIRLHSLAPALALAAWPLLASGLHIVRGIARGQLLEGYRTAGIVVALLGVVLQLAALAVMWPQPLGLVVVGLVNAAGLFFVAVHHRFPVAHTGVMACLGVAWLAGFQLAADPGLRELQHGSLIVHVPGLGRTVLHSMLSAPSVTLLAGLALIFAGIAGWLAMRGRGRHARAYAIGCGVTAVIGLIAISVRGITGVHSDALYAAGNFGFYGLASVLISIQWRRSAFGYVGWNLLGAAPFWALQAPLFATSESTLALAGCMFWLAAIWLLLAWMHRSRDILMAGQWLLTAATVVATTAWLQTQSWVAILPKDLFDARSLQSYGVALALLSLGWIAVRLAVRGTLVAERLFGSEEPAVDWVVRHAVVWGQALVAVVYVLPGVARELCPMLAGPATSNPMQIAGGPAGWILLGTLAIVWIAALWERWAVGELIGAILLAATPCCLLAGHLAEDVATASMLRWALAACFAVCSVSIWQRTWLSRWCRRASIRLDLNTDGPRIARAALLATTAVPVVAMTLLAAGLQFALITPGGPVADSFFDRLGPNVSYLVPLVVVILALVGHALRERSAGYAFSAGLVTEMAAALGYALSVVLANPPRAFGVGEVVTLVQCVTIAGAAWGMAWLLAQRWSQGTVPFFAPAKRGLSPSSPYLSLQIAIPIVANIALLAAPVVRLVKTPAYLPPQFGTIADGWGWVALVLTAAAAGWYLGQTMPERLPHLLGGLLSGVGVLAACDMTHFNPPAIAVWLEYHVLTASWAAAALVLLGIGFLGRRRVEDRSSSATLLSNWITWVAAMAVALALLYSPIDRDGAWWSLRTIGAMSVATAFLALWLRLPSRVFFSGLLCCAAGAVAWLAWGNRHDPLQLAHTLAICLAGASAVWTSLELATDRGVPHFSVEGRPVVFAHYAAALGLAAVAAVAVLWLVVAFLGHPSDEAVTRLAWIALGSVAGAILLTIWDRLARLALLGLYLVGFTALVMIWDTLAPTPRASVGGCRRSCPATCLSPRRSVGWPSTANGSCGSSAFPRTPIAGVFRFSSVKRN